MIAYNSEEDFVNEVEQCLKQNGCQTWREVIPDQCEKWEMPYRVDLIFYRNDIGFIGVEAKNTNTLGAGGKIYNAIKQIDEKYRNKTYFKGNMIERWALLVPKKANSEIGLNTILIFLRGFLINFNIELLEYNFETKWRTARVTLGAFSKKKIDIGGDNKWQTP